jgi:hypothetical protein
MNKEKRFTENGLVRISPDFDFESLWKILIRIDKKDIELSKK